MKKQVFVGGTLKEAAVRIAEAWRRAGGGEVVDAEDNVTFAAQPCLTSAATQRRCCGISGARSARH